MISVIFFLAHDGIKQPHVWENWITQCNQINTTTKVHARVFCNFGKVSNNTYFRDKVLHFNLETGWCQSSLVKALQLGYQEIINEFEDTLEMIYLVSGNDIPIMTPRKFINFEKKSYFPLNELETLDRNIYNTLEIYSISKKQPTKFSTQWMHVTKKHAKIIAKSNLSIYENWLNKLKQQEPGQKYCYDEVIPCAMLEVNKCLNEVVNEALTDMQRKEEDDPSPINFTSLTKKYYMFQYTKTEEEMLKDMEDGELIDYLEEGEIKQQLLTLEEVLKESRDDDYVFFRKVSDTVHFTKMPWLD